MTARGQGSAPPGHDAQDVVLECAALLHANGQSTDMTVTAVERLNEGLGVSSTLVPSWSTVTLVDQVPRVGTTCEPATPSSINMRRVSAVMRVVDRAEDGPLQESQVRRGLSAASIAPGSGLLAFVLACATGAGALAVIFGETAPAAVAVVAASAALGGILRRGLARLHLGVLFQLFAAAVAAGLVGAGAVRLGISDTAGLMAVCPCLVMVPGPHILNGVLDLLSTRITLGAARLIFAVTLLVAIGAGLILGLRAGGQTLSVAAATTPVPFYVDSIAAAVAAGSYAVYFSMPARMMWWPALVGMLTHAVHWYAVTVINLDVAAAAMASCLLVGSVLVPISHRCRIPFAAVGFASVVSLIPGSYVFRSLSGVLQLPGSHSTTLLESTLTDGITAVLVVGAVSIGLAIPKHLYGPLVGERRRRGAAGAGREKSRRPAPTRSPRTTDPSVADRRHPTKGRSTMDTAQRTIRDAGKNRGTAFTTQERTAHGLVGRLPSAVESLEQQAARSYGQLLKQPDDLSKYLYLDSLHDRNEVLYFTLLAEHLAELLPIVYDPTIGDAIEQWSTDYRESRAVYLSVDRVDEIKASFETLELGPEDVDLIVVSDAQEILGIGDWGVNGTDIAIGKLAIYTAAAGIHPNRVIAVNLDVGTDNQALLEDPAYLGNRHPRVEGKRYDEFIDAYLAVASSMFPDALLHFEDFGPSNARRILVSNADKYRIFNDDMQGTGAIVMASVISALKVTGGTFADQRLVVFGAGTAGTGMADQLSAAMRRSGASSEQALSQVWIVDKDGLVTDDMPDLPDYQQVYARPATEVEGWSTGPVDLVTVIKHVKPNILIGTSTAHGAFTREVVEAMAEGVERPILLPLSNPTSRIEVMPADAVAWSHGNALVAAGIPVDPVEYDGTTYTIGQANNALLYPGLGLGTIVSGASAVTDGMLLAAAEAVAGQVDVSAPGASLLPSVEHLRDSSAIVAVAVAKAADADGVATRRHDDLARAVQDAMWVPTYAPAAAQG